MAFSRQIAVMGLLGASYVMAVGCGSDDAKKSAHGADAGQGGEAMGGDGGTPSLGGSMNGAGTAGTAVAGGQGGAEAMGGAGGTDEGGATSGGEAPGSGGAGEGGETAAGGVNAGGAGGAGGAPEPMAAECRYQCEIDDDCQLVDAPPQSCNQTTHRCENPALVCAEDADCLPAISEWGSTCSSDQDCFAGFEACVSWNGQGFCAWLPDYDFEEPCFFGIPTQLPSFPDQDDVEVCASPDARCFDGKCAAGCGDSNSGGCGLGDGDTCSEVTGHCECQEGTECDTGVCGEDSRCVECVTSDDCAAQANFGLGTCVGGECGCSSADSCPALYPEATAVCE